MFAEFTDLTLGDTTVRVKRLTRREIAASTGVFAAGVLNVGETLDKLIADHVTLVTGEPVDPQDLTIAQQNDLVKALIGIPEGRGISDFTSLLCCAIRAAEMRRLPRSPWTRVAAWLGFGNRSRRLR